MSATDIYDFENIIEAAAATVFAAAQIQNATTLTFPAMQKVRPRVEIIYIHGAGKGMLIIPPGTPPSIENRRESCWSGQLKLELITQDDIVQHCAFRSSVRAIMATFWTLINGQGGVTPWSYSDNGGPPPDGRLSNHKLQFARDAGTTPVMVPERGYLQTTMLYDTDLSVQANAWALLYQ